MNPPDGTRSAVAGTSVWAHRRRMLLIVCIALALLAVLSQLAPAPERLGLSRLSTDRVRLMEPGVQEQARHPMSVSWSLPFSQQFEWPRDVERQWHFKLDPRESRDDQLALFIPNAGGPLSVFVNGARAGTGSEQHGVAAPGMGGWLLSAAIGQRADTGGKTRIDLLQASDLPHAGIRAMYLGPRRAVADATSEFGRWFGGLRMFARIAAVLGGIGVLTLSLTAQPWPRVVALALVTVGSTACLFAPPGQHAWQSGACAAAVLSGSVLALMHWGKAEGIEAVALCGMYLAAALSALVGLALLMTPWLPTSPVLWLQLAASGALPLLICGAPIVASRSIRQMPQQLARARQVLVEKERLIIQQQQLLDQSIRDSAVLEERERFARDMHDGIGGHLQGLLMRVRAGKIAPNDIASELQHGLTDLRMMVDSLDQLNHDVHAALETFRVRALPQLEAAEVTLEWRLSPEIRTVTLDPKETLNLYRILQEILANCIRYAQATRFCVEIGLDQDRRMLLAVASDDGIGFDPATTTGGKGLKGMRQRIAKAGGVFDVSSNPGGGTRIAFQLPVPDDTASEL